MTENEQSKTLKGISKNIQDQSKNSAALVAELHALRSESETEEYGIRRFENQSESPAFAVSEGITGLKSEAMDSAAVAAQNAAGIATAGQAATGSIDMKMAFGIVASSAKEVGKAIVESGEPHITSALGDEAGTVFSSVVSGTATGTAIGAAVAPLLPWSVVIGGVAGAAVGFFTGLAKNFEKQDDAFKDYYKEQFKDLTTRQEERLTSGINLAGMDDYAAQTEVGQALERTFMDQAMGRGYIEVQSAGQADYNGRIGALGPNLDDAYAMVGAFRATLENTRKDLEAGAMEFLLTGRTEAGFSAEAELRLAQMNEEYQQLQKAFESGDQLAGAKVEALLNEAQGIAENEYNASDSSQAMVDANLELVGALRENASVHEEYYNTGYRMGLEFSKGLDAAAMTHNVKNFEPVETKNHLKGGRKYVGLSTALSSGPDGGGDSGYTSSSYGSYAFGGYIPGKGFAYGMERVPYDNFPALLHEGERVLTASQARAADSGGGVHIGKLADTVVVREEADLDKLARKFVAEARRAQLLAAPS